MEEVPGPLVPGKTQKRKNCKHFYNISIRDIKNLKNINYIHKLCSDILPGPRGNSMALEPMTTKNFPLTYIKP